MFFCVALWHNGSFYVAIFILACAWVVDDGLVKFTRLIKEPLVIGILVFCGVLVLGLLWSDFSVAFQGKWKKYFILLTFIPLLSLLNRERLPWAVGALLMGYLGVLTIGSYEWIVRDMQGVPLLKLSYLGYSAAIGIGVLLAAHFGCVTASHRNKYLSWMLVFVLLFLQFNQSSRGLLVATLVSLLLMITLRYRIERSVLIGGVISVAAAFTLFAASSTIFHERLLQAWTDLLLFQQGDYQTSLGYRLAMWEIGLRGIAEYPFLGHGTGMARQCFEGSILTYGEGVYQQLPEFQRTVHFHNEWIEIGVHLGLLGILALSFLLWCWYLTFKRQHMDLLGAAIVCYIVMAGLSHVFLLFSRIPPLLLVITAMAICLRESVKSAAGIDQKNPDG